MTRHQPHFWDICEGKHAGAPASVDAFQRSERTHATDREKVLGFIRSKKLAGTILKEIAAFMGKEKNQVSPRVTELLERGLVVDSKRRRDGCRVLVAREALFGQ